MIMMTKPAKQTEKKPRMANKIVEGIFIGFVVALSFILFRALDFIFSVIADPIGAEFISLGMGSLLLVALTIATGFLYAKLEKIYIHPEYRKFVKRIAWFCVILFVLMYLSMMYAVIRATAPL